MTGKVALLTTALMSSVDGRHIGSASRPKSAAARLAGMVATALSRVLGATGTVLMSEFHITSLTCAIISAGAAASVFFLISDGPKK